MFSQLGSIIPILSLFALYVWYKSLLVYYFDFQYKKYIWFIQDVQNDMTFISYACKIVFIYNVYVELERRKVSFKRKFVASI